MALFTNSLLDWVLAVATALIAFAALSITLDRPFVVGDFLIVDDLIGSVEYIGIKSTRLRSLSGEQIVMSNSDLLKSRVRNYGRMTERRVVFTTSITYETPIEHIERIPQIIRKIVEAQPDALRSQPLRNARRVIAGLRDRLLRPERGLQLLYGHAATDQPATAPRSDRLGRRVRILRRRGST